MLFLLSLVILIQASDPGANQFHALVLISCVVVFMSVEKCFVN